MPQNQAPRPKPIDVLMTDDMPTATSTFDDHFIVHRLWQAADRDALLAEVGGRVRGLARAGGTRVDDALMGRLPKLEIVANFGVGYDPVDVQAAARRNVMVTNTPDVLNDEVADLTLGLLLATVRRLPQADRFVREGRWLQGDFPLSPTLRGRRVGILGMGRIGQAIAERCTAFNVEVVYHTRNRREDAAYAWYPSLVEMARVVDVLIAIVPGGPATERMVNAEVLDALGPDGILINVARGSVVDEAALVAALRDGRILAAGLDVFAAEPKVPEELIGMDNVVLLPHVGSATHHTRGAMGQLVLDNLVSWFQGLGPLTPVVETPWSGERSGVQG